MTKADAKAAAAADRSSSVIVNGTVVVENATHTGALPGVVLRRNRAGMVQ